MRLRVKAPRSSPSAGMTRIRFDGFGSSPSQLLRAPLGTGAKLGAMGAVRNRQRNGLCIALMRGEKRYIDKMVPSLRYLLIIMARRPRMQMTIKLLDKKFWYISSDLKYLTMNLSISKSIKSMTMVAQIDRPTIQIENKSQFRPSMA